MYTIYRYPLELGTNSFTTYHHCRVLSIGIDPRGQLSAWVLVDTSQEKTYELKLRVVGTGWDLHKDDIVKWNYIGTTRQDEYMWHVFREMENREWIFDESEDN